MFIPMSIANMPAGAEDVILAGGTESSICEVGIAGLEKWQFYFTAIFAFHDNYFPIAS